MDKGLRGQTPTREEALAVLIIRTCAHVPAEEDFDYWTWCRAVRRGATFVTSGPLLRFGVTGHQPGQEARVPASGTVRVGARVQ
ncbi:hypothetical protein HNP84_005388 [Thermocatellispora tengchongensis]|uniref:Uncharacterized protein n=1 Tax=Thermocatellispora tengchongensis TaxID=1073253 RepID=A0A840P2Y5_9ACTN|nr:hypothetical protein [Thermocatellispora tengchongensis]MBB5135644.1 hypothetical protein [Thermocatellispora tengchongensis]